LVYGAALGTLRTSSLILFLATASNVFGAVFTRLGSATWLANLFLAADLPTWIMLCLLMVVIFILGWPLEWPAILFIFVPIFLPVIQAMKINLLWYGILLAVNLNSAFLSPPVAMAAYYIKAVAPDWELKDIYKGMFQFLILQLVGLIIVLLFPMTALWLPSQLFGK
jgi:TRAP-type mannitol/chloroaromatic compound transport system permease large subunit